MQWFRKIGVHLNEVSYFRDDLHELAHVRLLSEMVRKDQAEEDRSVGAFSVVHHRATGGQELFSHSERERIDVFP